MTTSHLEISRSALLHNVRTVKQHLGPASRIFAVVKGNAYGHGQKEVVTILSKEKSVAGFMVFEVEEALAVRKLTDKPIAVLAYTGTDAAMLNKAARANIILPILNLADARRLSRAIKGRWQGQIKIDVGTGRLGLPAKTALKEIQTICQLPRLKVAGVFSHFADSENDDQTFTREQHRTWSELLQQLTAAGLTFDLNHIACTAAMIRHPEYRHGAVRLGLGLYGLEPYHGVPMKLQPILQWKTKVLQSRVIDKGESIGYSQTYTVTKTSQLLTIPVGYYDGYDRRLSNKAHVIINGKKYPIAGRICMNVCMIIVPTKPLIRVGTEVTLIGRQGTVAISADDLADTCQTINYEITTRINTLLPRHIVS
jgi:alanine racemase